METGLVHFNRLRETSNNLQRKWSNRFSEGLDILTFNKKSAFVSFVAAMHSWQLDAGIVKHPALLLVLELDCWVEDLVLEKTKTRVLAISPVIAAYTPNHCGVVLTF